MSKKCASTGERHKRNRTPQNVDPDTGTVWESHFLPLDRYARQKISEYLGGDNRIPDEQYVQYELDCKLRLEIEKEDQNYQYLLNKQCGTSQRLIRYQTRTLSI